jgi:hypothetical protein
MSGSRAVALESRLLVLLGLVCGLAGAHLFAPSAAFAESSLYWSYPSVIDTVSRPGFDGECDLMRV